MAVSQEIMGSLWWTSCAISHCSQMLCVFWM